MGTHRSSKAKAGSNKVLWVGVAVVVIIVLVMGAALIRIQEQPQEPRLVALPTAEAPPANAPAVASTATEALTSATPLPPASMATDPGTNKPRIVQPSTPEPAVARAPERATPKLDAVEGETLPGVKR